MIAQGVLRSVQRSPWTAFDAESGLIYLRARYYDPATAQFLARDPLVAITESAYGYVGGNPLNGVDSSGMSQCGQFSLGGLVDCVATGSHDPVGTFEEGWNSMSTGQKVADVAPPVIAAGGLICVAGGCAAAATAVATCPWLSNLLNLAQDESGAMGGPAGNATVDEILSTKLWSVTRAPLPEGAPSWDAIRNMTLGQIREQAAQNAPGYRTILKLLTDSRFNK